MSERKTPILLRKGPLSGNINALYRYRRRTLKHTGQDIIDASGKWDVTADFDALVCELLLDPAPDIIAILDGVGSDIPLDDAERRQAAAFREALIKIVERHNAGPHVHKKAAA